MMSNTFKCFLRKAPEVKLRERNYDQVLPSESARGEATQA